MIAFNVPLLPVLELVKCNSVHLTNSGWDGSIVCDSKLSKSGEEKSYKKENQRFTEN